MSYKDKPLSKSFYIWFCNQMRIKPNKGESLALFKKIIKN